jgi:hypothetical protein
MDTLLSLLSVCGVLLCGMALGAIGTIVAIERSDRVRTFLSAYCDWGDDPRDRKYFLCDTCTLRPAAGKE